MPDARLDLLVLGAGRIGRAVARRAADAGLVVGLGSRRAASVRSAAATLPRAVRCFERWSDAIDVVGPEAPWLLTVDRAVQAVALLEPLGARLAGRTIVLACFDTPRALDAAAAALEAHGARVAWLGVLGTAAALAEGKAPLLTDAASLGARLAPLGPITAVSSRAIGARVTLAFPVAYTTVLVLCGLVLRAADRVGLDLEDALGALEAEPSCARPLVAVCRPAPGEGVDAEAAAHVDALFAEVARALPALGLSAEPIDALAALWAGARDDVAAQEVDALLAPPLGARRLGALTRVVGFGARLALTALRRGLGHEVTEVLERTWADVDVVAAPIEVARALAGPRFVLGLRGQPQVEVAQVAAELARAVEGEVPGGLLGRWVGLLADLTARAAARAEGEPTDVSLVHLELGEPAASDAKRAALAALRAHHSPGRVAFFERAGISFVQGAREGPYLADLDDTRVLLNLHTNGGTFNFGHRAPALARALRDGLEAVDVGNHHLPSARRARLAARLTRTFPARLSRVCFSPSATEATDFVVRLARAATGRRRVLAFEGSFHGTTGVGAHMGDARFVDWAEPRSVEVTRAPRYALDAVARAIEGGDVAVVVAETLQASSGMHPPPRGFYAALSALCRAADVPLVLDEVQTGWGRTGKLWAFEHFDVEPDAVVLGKGMTGGLYPMAACVYDPRLAARLERDPFVQQSTGGGAELGCVVTERVLDLVDEPGFLPNVRALAARLAEGLARIAARQPIVRDVHQLGLFCSIGLADPALGPLLTRTCFERGLLVVFAGLDPRFVQLLPPLDLEPAVLDHALARLEDAIAEAARLAAPPTLGRARGAAEASAPRADDPPDAPPAVVARGPRIAGARAAGLALHDPELLSRLGWTPGDPHPDLTPLARLPGLLGDGVVVALGRGPDAERVALKPLPRFDAASTRDAYGALLEAYVAGLRGAGLRVLDTWLWYAPRDLRAWVVQPALAEPHLLPQRLGGLSSGERRGLFRRIFRLTQAAQARGLGVDAHLTNWSLSAAHVLDPVLLDVTQPLLRDGDGRLRLRYGDAGVPLALERFLSSRMVEDLFSLEPTIADVVANLRLNPLLAPHEAELVASAAEVLGRPLDPGALARATTKVRALRGTINGLGRVLRAAGGGP